MSTTVTEDTSSEQAVSTTLSQDVSTIVTEDISSVRAPSIASTRAISPTDFAEDASVRMSSQDLSMTLSENRENQEANSATLEPLEVVEETPQDGIRYPSGSELGVIIMAIGLSLIVIGLDSSILATAVPSITNDFKTIADVGWYYSAYRLCTCSFQFMFGKMYTIYSMKWVFLIAVVIFEVGSLVCGLAPSSKVLVLGRAIAGLGSAGIVSGVFTMVRYSVPLRRRPIMGAIAAGLEGISESCGPLLGGEITDRISWRWCFLINPPLGVITFVAVFFFFKDPVISDHAALSWKQKIGKLNLLGTAVFVPSIVALLLALQWGGSQYGWANARIIVLFCVFVVTIILFFFMQHRKKDDAVLPLRIIKQRSIISGMIFSSCNAGAYGIVNYYMPTYFQVVKETSAAKSGILSLPLIVGQIIAIILGGPTVSLIGYYVPVMLLTSILAPIAAGLLTTLKIDTPLASLIGYQALLGLGNGIGHQGPQVAAQTIFSTSDAALGIAAVVFAQNFGPAIFVSAAQTIFTSRLTADLTAVAPQLDATAVDSMGLSDLKRALGPKNLEAALLGYDEAVTQTFYLPVGLTCATLLGSLAMEWRSVKEKRS